MLNKIISAIKSRRNLLISGGAGVGKTHLLNQIAASRELGNVQVLAPTAIAAVASGGRTVHSFFRFRLASSLAELKISPQNQRELLDELGQINVLIIDEISMLSAALFDMIDHFLQLCAHPPVLVLVGDFYQLAPISKDRAQTARYAFCSPRWAAYDFALVELCTQHRMDDAAFYAQLAALRTGCVSEEMIDYFAAHISDEPAGANADYTVVCGTNQEADAINLEQISTHPGDLLSAAVSCKAERAPSAAKLRAMIAQTPLLEQLDFKLGCRVIVTMNSAADGVYNGMQATVAAADLAAGHITLATPEGKRIKLRPASFNFDAAGQACDDAAEAPIAYTLSGFALKLAYAITIHKSQGMSIRRLVCKCDRIFAAGQLYVAFSRASSAEHFRIAYAGNRAAFGKMLRAKARSNAEVDAFYASCPRADWA